MPITFRCNCGKKLQVPEEMAGKKVRCADCQAVVTVPGGETPMEARVTEAPARRARPVADEPAPVKRPKSSRKSGGRSNGLLIGLILGGLALVMLVCLGVGGVAAYFIISSKGSAETTLIGGWETDPEPSDRGPIGMILLVRMQFNPDHTYRLECFAIFDGKWRVASHSGNKLTVKMTMNFMGMKTDGESTPTITVFDKDHIEFDANEPGFLLNARLRRVGSGGRPLTPIGGIPGLGGGGGGIAGPKPDPNAPGLGDRGKQNPEIDKGMVADCEIEFAGQWYEGKILKTEKDRWFVHYVGWSANWDEWVGMDRIRFKKK